MTSEVVSEKTPAMMEIRPQDLDGLHKAFQEEEDAKISAAAKKYAEELIEEINQKLIKHNGVCKMNVYNMNYAKTKKVIECLKNHFNNLGWVFVEEDIVYEFHLVFITIMSPDQYQNHLLQKSRAKKIFYGILTLSIVAGLGYFFGLYSLLEYVLEMKKHS